MTRLTINQLVKVGFHVGSNKTGSIPHNYYYGYGYRNGITVIDLEQSVYSLRKASRFVEMLSFRGGKILFIAVSPIRVMQRLCFFLAKRSYQLSYSWNRWEGGFLSNWRELIRKRISSLRKITVKDRSSFKRRLRKYAFFRESLMVKGLSQKTLGRSRRILKRICRPKAVFLMNDRLQSAIVSEVGKVQLPLIGLVNTNMSCSSMYSFPIYGNTDSIAVQRLVSYCVAYSAIRGLVARRRILYRRLLSSTTRSVRSERIKLGLKKG